MNDCNPEPTPAIWLCESTGNPMAEEPAWMTADEAQRLTQLSGAARDDFLASRWLIRRALSEASGTRASECKPVQGRPDRSDQPTGWRLSLSHSAGLAGCAVSWDVPIGLDLEPMGRRPQWQKVVSRWFSPQEQAWLLAADDSDAFLKVWTLKEAWLKATGRGIANNLKTLDITADFELSGDRPGEPWRASLGKSAEHWVAVIYQSDFAPQGFSIPRPIELHDPEMAAPDARPVDWLLQKHIHSISEAGSEGEER